MSFEARYRGKCAACGDRIEEGDEVTYDDDDELIHDECDDDDFADLNTGWKTIQE